MQRKERIPLHDHSDGNSGGRIGSSGLQSAVISTTTTTTTSGGAANLSELGDVNVITTPPADNDSLTYDSASGKWIPEAVTSTVAALDDVGDVNAPTPSDGDVLTWDSTPGEWVAAATGAGSGDTSGAFYVGYHGGGSALTAGAAQDVIAPFTGTITGWTILADTSSSATIGIGKADYAGYDTFTSIVAAAPPTLTTAVKAQSSTLTGWTTAVTAGDVLRFTLSSVSTATRLLVVVDYSRP